MDRERETKALELIASRRVHRAKDGWFDVQSSKDKVLYRTTVNVCNCKDHIYRHVSCKHILAVRKYLALEKTIQNFMSERNITIAAIATTLKTKDQNATTSALIAVAEKMAEAEAKAKATTENQASVRFQLRYWWPGTATDAERGLDTLFPNAGKHAERIEVRSGREFRESKWDLPRILEYCADNDLTLSAPVLLRNENVTGWMGQYLVEVA